LVIFYFEISIPALFSSAVENPSFLILFRVKAGETRIAASLPLTVVGPKKFHRGQFIVLW
jgi:hypothetical protein